MEENLIASTSSTETIIPPSMTTKSTSSTINLRGITTRAKNGIKVPSNLLVESNQQELDLGELVPSLNGTTFTGSNSNNKVLGGVGSKSRWTREEDILLLELIQVKEPKVLNWQEISEKIENRNSSGCMMRWYSHLKADHSEIVRVEPKVEKPPKVPKVKKVKALTEPKAPKVPKLPKVAKSKSPSSPSSSSNKNASTSDLSAVEAKKKHHRPWNAIVDAQLLILAPQMNFDWYLIAKELDPEGERSVRAHRERYRKLDRTRNEDETMLELDQEDRDEMGEEALRIYWRKGGRRDEIDDRIEEGQDDPEAYSEEEERIADRRTGRIEEVSGLDLLAASTNDLEHAQALIGFLAKAHPAKSASLPTANTWTSDDDLTLSNLINQQSTSSTLASVDFDWNEIAIKLGIGATVVDCRTRWGYLVALGNKRRVETEGEDSFVNAEASGSSRDLPIPGTIGDLLFNAVPTIEQYDRLQQAQQLAIPLLTGSKLVWDPSHQNHSSALDDFIPQAAFLKPVKKVKPKTIIPLLRRKGPLPISRKEDYSQSYKDYDTSDESESEQTNSQTNVVATLDDFPNSFPVPYQTLPRVDLVAKPPIPFMPDAVVRGRRTQDASILASTLFSPQGRAKKVHICPAEHCGAAFKRSEHLKRHYRALHTGSKPFPCDWTDCKKLFSRRDNLQQRMSMVHGVNSGEKVVRVYGMSGRDGIIIAPGDLPQHLASLKAPPSTSKSPMTPARNGSNRKSKSSSASMIALLAAAEEESDQDKDASGDEDDMDDSYDNSNVVGGSGFRSSPRRGRTSLLRQEVAVEEEEEEEDDVDADYDEDDEDDLNTPINFGTIGARPLLPVPPLPFVTGNHVTSSSRSNAGQPIMSTSTFPSNSTNTTGSLTIGEMLAAIEVENQKKRKLSLGSNSSFVRGEREVGNGVENGDEGGPVKRQKGLDTGSYERTQI